MKLFYVNVIEQNKNWGAEWFMNKAFNSTGVSTFNLDFRKYRSKLALRILKQKAVDCFLLQRGDYFPIEILKTIYTPKFFLASELVTRCRDQDRLFQSNQFDHYFVRTKECKRIISQNKWVDIDKISILFSSFDENTFKKNDKVNKDIDVLFVGNITERRNNWIKEIQKHFKVEHSKSFSSDFSNMINRAKIIINIHAEDFLDVETRVFEVLGAGGFLLTEKLSLDSPFINNEHLVEVNSLDQMVEKINYFLNNSLERNSIANSGWEEANLKHTYKERAVYLKRKFEYYISIKNKEKFWINRKQIKKLALKEIFGIKYQKE